jgi:ankyrin repeat protein
MTRVLLRAGAPVNLAGSENCQTALNVAALDGNAAVIQELLSAGMA